MDLSNYSNYLLWAGDRIRSLVSKLTEEELERELDYFSHNSIREICFHIIVAQEYCLAVVNNTYPKGFREKIDNIKKLGKNEFLEEWQKSDENLAKEFQTELDSELTFTFGEEKFKVAKYDYLLQYPSHTIFHRGQLIIALKKIGKEVIGTDYLFYLMEITDPEP